MTHEPRPTAVTFATNIIEGPGGLNDFENREVATSPHSDRVWAAIWTLRCLANPQCEGSGQALAAIMEQRNGLPTARPTLTADDPAGWYRCRHVAGGHYRQARYWDGVYLWLMEPDSSIGASLSDYTDFIGPLAVQPSVTAAFREAAEIEAQTPITAGVAQPAGWDELVAAAKHIFSMIEVELYESTESNEWHQAAKMLQRALAAAEAGDNQERKKP